MVCLPPIMGWFDNTEQREAHQAHRRERLTRRTATLNQAHRRERLTRRTATLNQAHTNTLRERERESERERERHSRHRWHASRPSWVGLTTQNRGSPGAQKREAHQAHRHTEPGAQKRGSPQNRGSPGAQKREGLTRRTNTLREGEGEGD